MTYLGPNPDAEQSSNSQQEPIQGPYKTEHVHTAIPESNLSQPGSGPYRNSSLPVAPPISRSNETLYKGQEKRDTYIVPAIICFFFFTPAAVGFSIASLARISSGRYPHKKNDFAIALTVLILSIGFGATWISSKIFGF